MITQLVFDISLVLMGCLLAFVSRNMDSKFGEPKQMIFSMYNIAFTGVILIVLFLAVDVEEDGKRMLQAIGIFWGTVISSAIFVLPRLMQGNGKRRVLRGTSVSGLNTQQLSGLNITSGSTGSSTAKKPICV
uniref:G-protein coupled receptors family 3 profile domain-containing protein n=1 Tax=Proboscia inermis TaxID=420281 RepID=A0A7S0C5V9_9STRA|mmetsp:Transcript_26711/g.27072  ORF Transcript_26711/g.27072 Transcript_26711/m.27072 type:complete len:132 (+) Transcript_26711:1-396(+)